MTDTARARASRRNAQKSTGPKTAAGKAAVARNARRHGLTLPVRADPILSREVETLARAIETSATGRPADAHGHAHACEAAEAMVDLRRVREAKLPLVAALDADPRHAAGPLRELGRLDRYERRALWRRKLAIRAFAAAVTAPPTPCQNLAPRHPEKRSRSERVSKGGPSEQAGPPHGSRGDAVRRSSP